MQVSGRCATARGVSRGGWHAGQGRDRLLDLRRRIAPAEGQLAHEPIAFVVSEIRGDRNLAERYLKKVKDAPPAGFQGPIVRPDMAMIEHYRMTHGTAEEQLRLLREKQASEMKRITDAASRATYEERARFAAFVEDLLRGGLGRRKLGAALVGAGIVMSVAANVVSSLA
jgi:hypothetical protein